MVAGKPITPAELKAAEDPLALLAERLNALMERAAALLAQTGR